MTASDSAIVHRHIEHSLGLPYPVTIIDAARAVMVDDHPTSIHIPDSEGLSRAVAVQLCLMPTLMIGAEVRFIRRVLHLSQLDFANTIQASLSLLQEVEDRPQWPTHITGARVRGILLQQLQQHALAVPSIDDLRQRVPYQYPTIIAGRYTPSPETTSWIVQGFVATP